MAAFAGFVAGVLFTGAVQQQSDGLAAMSIASAIFAIIFTFEANRND
ncbi:hypothetical protein [Gemmobacter lutimaris]|nr:hypothetical protein [Gemmobacter lutimaris]